MEDEFNEDLDVLETLCGNNKSLLEFILSLSPEKREQFLKELMEEEFD